MPLFYLHGRCDGVLVEDPDGSELPDLASAPKEALAAARDLWAEAIVGGKDLSDYEFIVTSEDGEHLLVIPYIDALPDGLRKRLAAHSG